MALKYLPFLLLLFLFACKPTIVDKVSLLDYVKNTENGVSKVYQVEPNKVVASIRPTDLVIEQIAAKSSQKVLDSLQKKYSKYWYFSTSFSIAGQDMLNVIQQQNYAKFSELLQVVSFRMPQYAYLTTSNQDTIQMADYSYVRLYGMSRSTDLLMVFENTKAQNAAWVQLNINEFGANIGDVRLRFETNDIKEIPKLKFEK
jgi:hypothetical protein